MLIDKVTIRNFRKLKDCSISFDENQTIFVGANNSGKTTAIQALVRFLQSPQDFSCKDFTISNWETLNGILAKWADTAPEEREVVSLDAIRDYLPVMDVWLNVPEQEVYLVKSLFPSLSWNGNLLGARLLFAPKDINSLYVDFATSYLRANVLKSQRRNKNLELFPKSLFDFLDQNNSQNLRRYFEIKYYVLDSAKEDNDNGVVQSYPDVELDENPFKDIIKIDIIEAHREFSDPEGGREIQQDTLSKQLQTYYRNNISPSGDVDESDVSIIEAIQETSKIFDDKLKESFSDRIDELKNINYPGFLNPSLEIHSYVDPGLTFSHESAVQFAVDGVSGLRLPERYNGLGYRNLISMYFRLIQFREEWINFQQRGERLTAPEKIHLVFIEEPEAHLHAQAQQVFIRKAFEALTNANYLRANSEYKTQLVVSTHSNHIANEVDLNVMRYFYRYADETNIPLSKIINLSQWYMNDVDETRRFVTRYLKLTHCDIFFADAVVLVEGAGERILMPHFLKKLGLDKNYISVIEINGSHAHRFKELVEKLNITTLVITDIDAQELEEDGKYHKHVTQVGAHQITNNDTLKNWIPQIECVDDLLKLPPESKTNGNVRVAYQVGINVAYKEDGVSSIAYPYTFEDALGLTNLSLFKKAKEPHGLILHFQNAIAKESLSECMLDMFEQLKPAYKAPFAIDLLYLDDFEDLQTPDYIREGLEWLKSQLESQNNG